MGCGILHGMWSKKWFWWVIIGVVLLIAALVWYFTQMATLVIAKPTVTQTCIPGKTVFNVLVLENTVETAETSLGFAVTSINHLQQGDGKYWSYSLDGVQASQSATQTICTGKEKILWELK